jgi:hypothetical protein
MMLKGFINFYKKNNHNYAEYCIAKRENGRKFNEKIYLGNVIDKEKGIFKSRERGIYKFSLESGFEIFDEQVSNPLKEKLDLSFGDSWLLSEILSRTGFSDALSKALPKGSFLDTLMALITYKIVDHGFALRYALEWYEFSYAQCLYPTAELHSQRVSEFLIELGKESVWRNIFKSYLSFLGETNCVGNGLLIDSTGLPNDINFYLTAINNHNGVISDEVRLIYAIDRFTKMPIYFRYVPGNIVDINTLLSTIEELGAYRIDIKYLILDAGFYSEENIKSITNRGVSFVIRLKQNVKLYKDLLRKNLTSMLDIKYLYNYNERSLFIRKVIIDLFGSCAYAFVCVDPERQAKEINHFAKNTLNDDKIPFDKKKESLMSKGFFIILSSENVEPEEILPLYYTRQSIEQVFDIGKNCADLLPLRTHNIETFRGHLMLSFLSTAAYILTMKEINSNKFCPIGVYHLMKNLRVKIFDTKIIIQEPTKKMREIIDHLKLELPNKK